MDAFIMISLIGDGGGGVSGRLVCIVVDGDIGLLRKELKEEVVEVDGCRLRLGECLEGQYVPIWLGTLDRAGAFDAG